MQSDSAVDEPTLETIAALVAGRPQPKVLVLESLDPVTPAHQAHPLITACGGTRWSGPDTVSDTNVLDWNPDIVVLLADADAMDDAEDDLKDLEEWMPTAAARGGDCYCAVRETFHSKPRVLATILHPDLFTQMLPPHCVRIAIPRERPAETEDSDDESGDEPGAGAASAD